MNPTNIDIIRSFAQGEVKLPSPVGTVGNCASIALIKAAIEVFGMDNIFQMVEAGNTYRITFKNGKQVSFTDQELARSIEVAGLVLNVDAAAKIELYTSIYNFANIALCAMAKRVMEIGESGAGIGNFESALRALHDGANSPGLAEKLGLEEYCYRKRLLSGSGGKGMFGWLKAHTVYISQGVRDDYGKEASDTWRYPNKMQLIQTKTQ